MIAAKYQSPKMLHFSIFGIEINSPLREFLTLIFSGMGIYSDGKIYGISIRLDVVVYEKTYDEPITSVQIQEAKDFYHSVEAKDSLQVSVYVKCSSTYVLEQNSFMSWIPSNLISKE